MEWRTSFFCSIVVAMCIVSLTNAANSVSDMIGECRTPSSLISFDQRSSADSQDTTGKEFKPRDPFPAEKQFSISSVFLQDSLLQFQKGDVIRISTKSGLKHYRNKRLLNVYKIIPQLAIITIQPQCRVTPCPPMDIKALVYYLGNAERFIDIRNNALLISEDTYTDANTPTTALRLKWKKAYGFVSK